MILGVVLAGGQSTRFGSDKALAELGGHTLIARAFDTLTGFCELVVIAGRERGPGLHLARDDGYDSVLTLGVDSLGVPDNLLELLSPAPAFIESQPVIGHWPTGTVDVIETLLLADGRHSMLAFAEAVGATAVKIGAKPANINTPADLAAVEKTNGI